MFQIRVSSHEPTVGILNLGPRLVLRMRSSILVSTTRRERHLLLFHVFFRSFARRTPITFGRMSENDPLPGLSHSESRSTPSASALTPLTASTLASSSALTPFTSSDGTPPTSIFPTGFASTLSFCHFILESY